MNNFSFEDRMEEIDRSISAYNELLQSSFISASDNLKKIIENSIVVAIYSLSEQLLKDTIYKILEVDFSQNTQTYKDKFILKKMPLNSPMTPDIDRIMTELKVYYSEFVLKVPNVVSQYEVEYKKLVDARHKYAHGNKHTQNIDFDYAKKFVEYLRAEYEGLVQKDSVVLHIFALKEQLDKLLKISCKKNFMNYYQKCKDKLENCNNSIRDKIDNNEIYDIDYIDNLYAPLEYTFKKLENIYNGNEYVTDDSFKEDMTNLQENLKEYD